MGVLGIRFQTHIEIKIQVGTDSREKIMVKEKDCAEGDKNL